MSAEHDHEDLPELPPHVARAVEAGAATIAPNLEGCMECARHVARTVVLAALEELAQAKPGPNGTGRSSRPARRRWRWRS